MRVWIDNTGLQSATSCIYGKGSLEHYNDPLGLLQLATLVVFSSEISLNGFEDPVIQENSENAISRLTQLGIDGLITIESLKTADYAAACRRAAHEMSDDLVEGFVPDEKALHGVEPPELPRGTNAQQTRYVTLLDKPDDELREIATTTLDDHKATGAIDYMIAISPQLRNRLRTLQSKKGSLGLRSAYSMNIAMRFNLNRCLADDYESTYMASVGRSNLVARRSDLVLSRVLTDVDDVVSSLRDKELGVPSVYAYLLDKSKGDPEGLVVEALVLREKTTEVRTVLGELENAIRSGEPRTINSAKIEIRKLGEQLRRDVGLTPDTKLVDAISFKLALGIIPTFAISGKGITRYWRERQLRKKLTAVADVALGAAAISRANRNLQRLYDRASINNPY